MYIYINPKVKTHPTNYHDENMRYVVTHTTHYTYNFTHILMFGQTGHGHNHPKHILFLSLKDQVKRFYLANFIESV